jgi:hypothetical protein
METKQDQLKWELQCYGMTKAQLNQMVKLQAFPGQEMMFAAGLLSDAQHVIDKETHEHNEGWVDPQAANQARQYINCAKAIIFNLMETRKEPI